MRKFAVTLAALGCLLALVVMPASAQDYRARVQGVVTDETQGAMPGVTVTLLNEVPYVQPGTKTRDTGFGEGM